MVINEILLADFRNYESLALKLSNRKNIFIGDNGAGKTNIIESIFVTSTTTSFRRANDREMIRLGCSESHIRVTAMGDRIGRRIDIHLRSKGRKGVAVDGIALSRSSDLLGLLPVVCFSPVDLGIVQNGPAERRRFIDMCLCQTDKIYVSDLKNYSKVLDHRNALLRQIHLGFKDASLLSVWDEQLAKFAKNLAIARDDFFDKLKINFEKVYDKISGNADALSLKYIRDYEADIFLDILVKTHDRDIKHQFTGSGPHRDDIAVLINAKDIRLYGSQGQQRSAALALKLAELHMMKDKHITPVLLLDDVMSELDEKRQNAVLSITEGIQMMVTCTGTDAWMKSKMDGDKIFLVKSGIISEIE